MIIDSHVHLVGDGWVHEDFFLGMGRMACAMAGKAGGDAPDARSLVDNLKPALLDPTGDRTVAAMDAAGVDTSCIFTVDYELATGFPGVTIMEQNRMVAEAARRFPSRLIPFFAIDPRREGSAEMFARSLEEEGMKGLKLHPASGYYPYQDCCYPLYRKCVEYGVPLLIHTGSQPAPLKFRFSLPVYVDDVAADFPDLPIIMAHVSHQLWQDALLVASVKPNIYFDISGWQITYNSHPAEFYRMLRRVLDEVGPWRVFFGTDGPYLNVVLAWEKWVEAVSRPDLSCCPEVSFSEEELEIITGRSFAKLLGLDARPG